ncbi:hypothetical protein POTOM_050081 [Populus tomentosa]|uniref:Uncharacterized protein n=1 Tax=Populus tomentosa TaxID=118781 RepID=A0A8X7Y351_POPTO|nr:hypothetical protein POTOM_050081 [Populus tomentosa]
MRAGDALPSGVDKLYIRIKDETVKSSGFCSLDSDKLALWMFWQFMVLVNLGGVFGCVISEGHWVFVGLPNAVKAWSTQVYALFVDIYAVLPPFVICAGKMVLLNCQFSALSCVDFTVPSPLQAKRIYKDEEIGGGQSVYNTLNKHHHQQNQMVCHHRRAEKCNRFPCPSLHRELPAPPPRSSVNGGGGGANKEMVYRE